MRSNILLIFVQGTKDQKIIDSKRVDKTPTSCLVFGFFSFFFILLFFFFFSNKGNREGDVFAMGLMLGVHPLGILFFFYWNDFSWNPQISKEFHENENCVLIETVKHPNLLKISYDPDPKELFILFFQIFSPSPLKKKKTLNLSSMQKTHYVCWTMQVATSEDHKDQNYSLVC